jgi:CRP-like cAMP-binding protein
VLRLPRDAVLELARSEPALMDALRSVLASVIRRLNRHAADSAFLDLPRRVGNLLLAPRAAAQRNAVGRALTRRRWQPVSGRPGKVSTRLCKEFQRRGWIRVAERNISIRDPSALARFVGS